MALKNFELIDSCFNNLLYFNVYNNVDAIKAVLFAEQIGHSWIVLVVLKR